MTVGNVVGNVVATAVFCALSGLFLLFMLWPDGRQGLKVLNRWGVRTPTDAEVTEAVGYLRRRRLWYPWLFTGLSLLGNTVLHQQTRGLSWWLILGTLLLGGLLAELFAFRPSRGTRRVADLRTRRLTDLVPGWMVGCYAVLGAAVLVVAVHGLFGGRWAVWIGFTGSPTPERAALGLLFALGSIAVVGAVLLLSVRRPSASTPQVDTALRMRSARVVLGLGLTGLGALVRAENQLLSLILVVACVASWLALTAQQRPISVAAHQV